MEDLLVQVVNEANGQKFTDLKKAAQEAYGKLWGFVYIKKVQVRPILNI